MITISKLSRFQAVLDYLLTIGSIGKVICRHAKRQHANRLATHSTDRLTIQSVDPYLTVCVEVEYKAFRTSRGSSDESESLTVFYLNIPTLLNILMEIPSASLTTASLTFYDIGQREKESHGHTFSVLVEYMSDDERLESSASIQNPKDQQIRSANSQKRYVMRSFALHPYVNVDHTRFRSNVMQPNQFHIECFAIIDIQTLLLRMSLVGSYVRWMHYKDGNKNYNQFFTSSDVGILVYRWSTHLVDRTSAESTRPFSADVIVKKNATIKKSTEKKSNSEPIPTKPAVARIRTNTMTRISTTRRDSLKAECIMTDLVPLRALRMIHNWTVAPPNKLEWCLQSSGPMCVIMEYDDYTVYGFACQVDAIQSQYDPVTCTSCAVEQYHRKLYTSVDPSVHQQLIRAHDQVVHVCCT